MSEPKLWLFAMRYPALLTDNRQKIECIGCIRKAVLGNDENCLYIVYSPFIYPRLGGIYVLVRGIYILS